MVRDGGLYPRVVGALAVFAVDHALADQLAPKLEVSSYVFHPVVCVEKSGKGILKIIDRLEILLALDVL